MCCTSGCTRLLYFTFPTLLLRQQPGFKEIPICDSGGSYPQSHIYKFCIKSHQNETWTQHKFSSRYIFSHESSSLQENCSLRKTQRPESYKSLALIQIYRLWTLFPFVPLEAEEGSSLCFSSWWHCCTETCSDPTLKKKKKNQCNWKQLVQFPPWHRSQNVLALTLLKDGMPHHWAITYLMLYGERQSDC